MAVRRARIKPVASIPARRKDPKNDKVVKSSKIEPSDDLKNETTDKIVSLSQIIVPPSSQTISDGLSNNSKAVSEPENIVLQNESIIAIDDIEVIKEKTPELMRNLIISPVQSTISIRKSNTPQSANTNFSQIIEKDKNVSMLIDGITPLPPFERINNRSLNVPNVQNSPVLSAECNFDPFVPLPSPTKNRQKLRPTPFIATRRNSFQGSTSESEDEIKKLKREEIPLSIIPVPQPPPTILPLNINNRRRNDSICSIPGDISTQQCSIPLTPRQKTPHKGHGNYMREVRKAAAKRKVHLKDPHNPLTMCDLIYYNPPNNNKNSQMKSSRDNIKNSIVHKQEVKLQPTLDTNLPAEDENNPIPVPQVKLGPNGEIIIDEQSLVIETTGTVKSRSELSKLSVVYESGIGPSTGGTYRRISRARDWTTAETLRFYKALNTVGTDFALMLTFFPGRTRRDLKVKFKREEKHNMKLVDKALMNPLNFDVSELEQPIPEEPTKPQKKREKPATKEKTIRKPYRKSSAALRSLGTEYKQTDNETSSNSNQNKSSSKTPDLSVTHTEMNKTPNVSNTLFPSNIEPGSLVLSVETVPGKSSSTLQAYLPQVIDGKKQMIPINLDYEMLKSIAKEMNIEQSDNIS